MINGDGQKKLTRTRLITHASFSLEFRILESNGLLTAMSSSLFCFSSLSSWSHSTTHSLPWMLHSLAPGPGPRPSLLFHGLGYIKSTGSSSSSSQKHLAPVQEKIQTNPSVIDFQRCFYDRAKAFEFFEAFHMQTPRPTIIQSLQNDAVSLQTLFWLHFSTHQIHHSSNPGNRLKFSLDDDDTLFPTEDGTVSKMAESIEDTLLSWQGWTKNLCWSRDLNHPMRISNHLIRYCNYLRFV